MADNLYMTQEGLDKLKKELADALAQRPVISAAIAEAREKGGRMMKRLFRQSSAALVIVLLLLSLASCGRKEPGQDSGFFLYYREQSERTLYPVDAAIDSSLPIETQVSSVWSQLTEVAGGLSYISVVPENVKLLSFDLVEKELVLNYSAEYAEMSPAA